MAKNVWTEFAKMKRNFPLHSWVILPPGVNVILGPQTGPFVVCGHDVGMKVILHPCIEVDPVWCRQVELVNGEWIDVR